jgi:hypothetical protein
MRLALVLGSAYEKNEQLPRIGSAEIDCELAARRLAEPDAGFCIRRFAADRNLPDELERVLSAQNGSIEQLLVYFSGYAVLSAKRGPGLLLDSAKVVGLSARVLRNLLERHAPVSCVIIDAAAMLEPGQTVASLVSAMGTTLTQGSSSVSALVGARPSHAADSAAGSPFTSLLVTVLDWLASGREPHQRVDLGRLFEGLCADASMWRAIPAGQLFPNTATFTMLPPVDPAAGAAAHGRSPSDRPALQVAGEEPAQRHSVYINYAHGTARMTVSLEPTQGGSATALEQMLATGPEDLALRDRLVELYTDCGYPERALRHCRLLARLAPTRAQTYRRARRLFERAGVPDAAWNAASVLACLGAADTSESSFAHQHKPDGLLAVRDTIFDHDWQETLMPCTDEDHAIGNLLAVLGPAAVRIGVGFARQKKRYFEPHPGWLHDLDKSTTTLAKTLVWTTRVLGISPPSLYVVPDLGATFEVAPTEEASSLAGRGLGSGLGLSQLAFLWGRHLCRFRPELRAFTFFRTPAEVASLLEATAAFAGSSSFDTRTLDADAKRLHGAVRAELPPSELERLRGAAHDLSPVDLVERARRALVRAELIGVRAGLVACGDVSVAADLIDRFPENGLTTLAEQKGELFAFAISDAYDALRQRLGVALAA